MRISDTPEHFVWHSDEEFFFSDEQASTSEIIRAARRVLLSDHAAFAMACSLGYQENNDLILLPSLVLFNALEAPEIQPYRL